MECWSNGVMGGVGKLEEEVTEVESSSEIYMKRARKVMLGLVGFVVVLGCVWTPVCKTLFPERVKAVNAQYRAVLAGQAGAKK
jgi:hypothetical protein